MRTGLGPHRLLYEPHVRRRCPSGLGFRCDVALCPILTDQGGGRRPVSPATKEPTRHTSRTACDAGDMFLGQNARPTAAYFGTDHFNTIIHEMGHAFGLKHGHDGSFHGTLAPAGQRQRILGDDLRELPGIVEHGNRRVGGSRRLLAAELHDVRHRRAAGDVRRQLQQGRHQGRPTAGTRTTGQQPHRRLAAPHFTGYDRDPERSSRRYGRKAPPSLTTSASSPRTRSTTCGPATGRKIRRRQACRPQHGTPPRGHPAQYMAQGNVYNALLYHGDLRSAVRQPDRPASATTR